jgi:hypothetical protein
MFFLSTYAVIHTFTWIFFSQMDTNELKLLEISRQEDGVWVWDLESNKGWDLCVCMGCIQTFSLTPFSCLSFSRLSPPEKCPPPPQSCGLRKLSRDDVSALCFVMILEGGASPFLYFICMFSVGLLPFLSKADESNPKICSSDAAKIM